MVCKYGREGIIASGAADDSVQFFVESKDDLVFNHFILSYSLYLFILNAQETALLLLYLMLVITLIDISMPVAFHKINILFQCFGGRKFLSRT